MILSLKFKVKKKRFSPARTLQELGKCLVLTAATTSEPSQASTSPLQSLDGRSTEGACPAWHLSKPQ